ncbi:hypothetical protein PR202_gb14674 [Eleusine coracana subsp. coracana]|uniref:Uncharacterized protein n=1 Tax=Eleusine coracana subsp. coracana TaxID=191504 RepID=A0AAV5EW13_ELECO|nr:hypothetical protein PR202_gb14674 [Eleusine coracana subsp. coracana]
MRRSFEEISDDEWSNHPFKSSRVLKRSNRSSQPPAQPPPPIDSFRYDPKAASGTSSSVPTVVLSDDDDFDLGIKDRPRRKEKPQPILKRPQHKPASRAPPSKGSFRNNPKPSKAAAAAGPSGSEDDDFDIDDYDFDIPDSKVSHQSRSSKAAATSGPSGSEEDEFDLEDDDSDLFDDVSDIPASRTSSPRRTRGRRLVTAAIDISDEDEDEDLGLADDDFDYQDPKPSRSHHTAGRRFVIGDDDDSDGPVTAGAGNGNADDEINWSELENEDDEDQDYNSGRSVDVEEDEGDVVGMALRKCSRISTDLRRELGSSARNCDSYAEIDASTCRIVTQEDVNDACSSESGFDPVLKPYQLVGVNFLLLLHRKKIGGGEVSILADEMGLGKTVQDAVYLPIHLTVFENLLSFLQAVTYLALLRHLYDDPGPHLIVCPASVLENWEREIKKWCPSFSIIMFHGAGRTAYSKELSSLGRAGCPAPFNVLLVGYSLFERRSAQQKDDRKALKRWPWSCVLMDEAHVLKDKGSFRWKNLMAVARHARQRLMLTGTPLQNDLHELWSLLEFMMPDIFATGDVDLKKLLNAEDHELISRIKSILGPFILRRMKSDVMQQLVPKIQHVKFVIMGSEQSKAYKNAIDEYRTACQARSAKSSVDISRNVVGLIPKRQISNYFMQFRKIANHPLLIRRVYSDKDVDQIARLMYPKGAFGFECSLERAIQELKNSNDFAIHQVMFFLDLHHHLLYPLLRNRRPAVQLWHTVHGTMMLFVHSTCNSAGLLVSWPALVELLPSLANGGHRVLIFSQWTTMLDILEWTLEVIGVTYRRLDGGTPVIERQTIVDTFNNDRSIFACLLSTRAGGQGLNLIGADTVIIHDMDFNPQMDRQAEDRCHRIGQQKPVTIYRLVTKESVDENIYEIARRKLVLDAAILQSGTELDDSSDVTEMTMGEILASLLQG